MNCYYLRATSREELAQIGLDLGLLVSDEAGTRGATESICWDEIGLIMEATGELDAEGMPIAVPIINAQGQPYWHANLYMPHVLIEWAQARHADAVAAGDETLADVIAQHIGNSPQYFPLDDQGQPRKPNNPHRVLWGAE